MMGLFRFLLSLSLLLAFSFQLSTPVFGLTQKQDVSVSAAIPLTRLTLFGYTSPLSKVTLTGQNIEDQVQSDNTGYFIFEDIIIPKAAGDLCLSSRDRDLRQTNTVCIPPPPAVNYNTSIGPILIPPNLTIDKEVIKPDETIIASGQTIPNSTVKIFFFQSETNAPSFPKEVQAFSLPALTIQSDADGNYSFNLPTAYATNYRLFASTLFDQDLASPQSNTLVFNLPSLWFLIWQRYSFYIIMIPLLIITFVIFIWLTLKYYFSQSPHFLPAIYQKSLVIRN